MSASGLAAPAGRALSIRGTSYPVLLPSVRDPRLHLAAVIISLQILGQVAFDFSLSIAQILLAIGTCALLEIGITFWRRRTLMWPASALLTGNGTAFVLRVPGTQHGDWWSLRGWWIFVGTAAVGLLSKYLIRFRGRHLFNPSNFGLVLCFLILGSSRADPLDFWWGPMTGWLALALAIIVLGGLAILSRLKLLAIAVGFWIAFAAGTGVLALSGHEFTARWHLGPVGGLEFWRILVLSPEILVFLFFMLTDPKTIPGGRSAQLVYAVGVGLLSALLIAPMQTEFGAKVAVLGSLAIFCAARPLLERRSWSLTAFLPARRLALSVGGLAVLAAAIVAAGTPARPGAATVAPLRGTGRIPQITILHSTGVSTQLNHATALTIARNVVSDLRVASDAIQARDSTGAAAAADGAWLADVRRTIGHAAGGPIVVPSYRIDRLSVQLRPGLGQAPPTVVAILQGVVQESTFTGTPQQLVKRTPPAPFNQTLDLQLRGSRYVIVGSPGLKAAALRAAPHLIVATSDGVRLQDVAQQVGLRFRQDDFRFGMANDVHSMMGGGVCWLDYNRDGWLDLFVVNSYTDADTAKWQSHGGLPRSALFENVHGRFVDVSRRSHADPAVEGNGCVPIDLGNGYPSLFITTNTYNVLLRNNGDGTFTNITHQAGIDAFRTYGWHTGAAVADVNGDGRPDIFVSGYADVNAPSDGARGFPLNYKGFRDLLYVNEGPDAKGHLRFRDVSLKAGIETKYVDHSLGAVFTDVNGDGRPDLYVANDLDPNRLYLNERGGPLGFHFVEVGRKWGVADTNAGMGVAAQDYSGDGWPDLFVTNSRGQGHAAFRTDGLRFTSAKPAFARAIGAQATGWGDSFVDLANDGRLDLVLANGAIPVQNVRKDAAPLQVLRNLGGGRFADESRAVGLNPGPVVDGRGLAAADYDNDGRVDIAVNSIGGRLVLLHNTGSNGNWLEVGLSRFAPGAVVTAILPDGRRLVREVQAGSSYLSSEDPRVHFGLGGATSVRVLTVRWPNGKVTRQRDIAADRIVTVAP
jgi:hypothetical protein